MGTYRAVAEFAQTWGLLYFAAIFAVILIYALWPRNRTKFDGASQIPLRED